jgi:microtubule-associated protein-like 5
MGQFLSFLKNVQLPQANPLIHNSISKLREYHGSFKSVCDTFSIDLTEYE